MRWTLIFRTPSARKSIETALSLHAFRDQPNMCTFIFYQPYQYRLHFSFYTLLSCAAASLYHYTWLWLLTVCRSPRWRADDIDLLSPAASLSLGQELHLVEGTSQSLEQQFGTISIFRPICDSTRSHCCHLDKN